MTQPPHDLYPSERLSPDEYRAVLAMRARAAASQANGPDHRPQAAVPPSATITPAEWELIQLHRAARSTELVATNHDPVRTQHAIAIVMLRDLQEEIMLRGLLDKDGLITVIIDRKLAVLEGRDGPEEAGSPDPGAR